MKVVITLSSIGYNTMLWALSQNNVFPCLHLVTKTENFLIFLILNRQNATTALPFGLHVFNVALFVFFELSLSVFSSPEWKS